MIIRISAECVFFCVDVKRKNNAGDHSARTDCRSIKHIMPMVHVNIIIGTAVSINTDVVAPINR